MILFYSRRGVLPLGEELDERLQVHRTSITNTVDGLEEAGYVERSPATSSDRRTTLARSHRRVAGRSPQRRERLNGDQFCDRPLRDAELEELIAIIRRPREGADDFSGP